MRSVSEVVWAAAHGKGMPVPYRACKLTRYLQDTLCPSGESTCCPKQPTACIVSSVLSPVLTLTLCCVWRHLASSAVSCLAPFHLTPSLLQAFYDRALFHAADIMPAGSVVAYWQFNC